MTSDTVFVFGRTPDLAFAELSHLIPGSSLLRIHSHAAVLAQSETNASEIMEQLGGTVTIGKVLCIGQELTPANLASYIGIGGPSSVTFGLSTLGTNPITETFLRQIKKELTPLGISVRYIVNKKSEPLSAVVVKGQKVQEYIIIPTDKGEYLVKTEQVQNVPEWVKRDFDRPFADPKRGMLPPKVARMLMNIVSSRKQGGVPTLLDPFCGMGTVLGEGLLTGWNVIGSDIAKDVTRKTKGNMEWITREYPSITTKYQVFEADAVHISTAVPPDSIDAIVTEPFMGTPSFAIQEKINPEEVKNTVKGLEKLYIGCLKDWSKILKKDGLILIALPSFRVNGRELFVKKVIDTCETLGYYISEGPWTYGRPNAVVERNFYLFKKI